MCQQFTETTTLRRLSEVLLAELLLVVSLLIIVVGSITLWVISLIDRPPVSTGTVSQYDFDFMEHQNYWEAENR